MCKGDNKDKDKDKKDKEINDKVTNDKETNDKETNDKETNDKETNDKEINDKDTNGKDTKQPEKINKRLSLDNDLEIKNSNSNITDQPIEKMSSDESNDVNLNPSNERKPNSLQQSKMDVQDQNSNLIEEDGSVSHH